MSGFINFIGWLVALGLIGITVMLALNKQSGLKLIQHRVDMLPQAMLVRYAGLTVLAIIAAWLGAPKVLFGVLTAIAIIGFGDAYIYRRAGHPFWFHLAIGGATAFGAFLSLFAMS